MLPYLWRNNLLPLIKKKMEGSSPLKEKKEKKIRASCGDEKKT
jgi:hypothetical protein